MIWPRTWLARYATSWCSRARRAARCVPRCLQPAAFDAAVETVGAAGMHPHKLRHTAASLAIASGADVKVAQQMLGHKSATMTLDLYGHPFPDRLDTVADAMDAARTVALNVAAEAGTGHRRDTAAVVRLRR